MMPKNRSNNEITGENSRSVEHRSPSISWSNNMRQTPVKATSFTSHAKLLDTSTTTARITADDSKSRTHEISEKDQSSYSSLSVPLPRPVPIPTGKQHYPKSSNLERSTNQKQTVTPNSEPRHR
jgi:hypothetical protein